MAERICIEEGCEEIAGTPWTHLWCPTHDEERRERITRSMEEISTSFGVAVPWDSTRPLPPEEETRP